MAPLTPGGQGAQTHDGTIARARLLALLSDDSAAVTVLQAPSGFGKTTLVRQWARDLRPEGERLVWVALTAEVESDHSLWGTVLACARRLGLLTPERADELTHDVDAHDDPVPVLRDLLTGRAPVVLVLDAYEHARKATPQVDDDILRLTADLPNLRVVVTTRAATSLAVAARQLRGGVRVINEAQLQFTPAETRQFLAAHGSEDQVAAAADIHRVTRGYPLAIRAASLAIASSGVLPSRKSSEWHTIVAHDLSGQLGDSALADFVRDTAVAPYFDLDLAQALTGVADPSSVVGELEWNGFGRWVPYVADRPVFQYVDSLRDAVVTDLRAADPDRFRRGAGIVATWLHENDEHEAALGLAVDAARYELASRIYRSVLLSSPESYTNDHLDSQLSRIPRPILMRYPMLTFARGLAMLSNPATRGTSVEYFARVAGQNSEDWRKLDRPASFFQQVTKSVALRFIGRYVDALTAARSTLEFYDDTDIGDDERLVELRAIGLRHIGYSYFQAGELEGAREIVGRAIATATQPWSRNYTIVYGVGLSAIEGRCHDADHYAAMVDEAAWPRDHAYTYVNSLGRIGNAMLLLDRFDFTGALREYDGCESFIHTGEFWPFLTWTLLQARLGLGEAGPEVERIAHALKARPAPPGTGDNFGTAMLSGLVAIAWIGQGRVRDAAAILQAPCRWPGQLAPAQLLGRLGAGDAEGALHLVPRLEEQAGHSVRSRTALATLGAAAALRAGSIDAAGALLDRAAALHDEYGARAMLLHVPVSDRESLREFALETGRNGAAAYLDVDVDATVESAVASSSPLTTQEIAVLRASLDKPRRNQVAAALHLSPETVKSHMRSIYRKWGVNSREAAIERGIQLGLLSERPSS